MTIIHTLKISWTKNKLTYYNKLAGELVAKFIVTLIIYSVHILFS